MSFRPVTKGSTDVSVIVRIIDATAGTAEEGVDYDTSGIEMWYRRDGGAKTTFAEVALGSLSTAHADGGIEHIDDGYYRLDLPDAACASGANGVLVGGAVTDMIVIGCYVPLVDYNPYDAAALGLTNLATLVNTTYGLAALEALVDELETRLSATRAGYLDELGSANIPADVDALLSRLSAARAGYLDALNGHSAQTGDSFARLGAPAGASIAADIAAVPTAAETRAELDANSTMLAAILADTDELQGDLTNGGRLDLLIDQILEDTNELQGDLTDGGRLDLILDAILADTGELQTDLTDGGRLDLIFDAILADTDELQADLTDGGRLDLILDAILEDTGTTIQTAISGLNNLSAAEVNEEMVDVLNVDTYAEPGQGAPPATTTLALKLGYLYKDWRNKKTQTSDTWSLYADDGSTVDQKSTISDDTTTLTVGEVGTGA